ncbi:MAG TPA: DUF1127 domain-containing protein [Azospirillaceae bacterium]|nr:DUF1127 domain-containing protein [Azospirillaceae bacterium]
MSAQLKILPFPAADQDAARNLPASRCGRFLLHIVLTVETWSRRRHERAMLRALDGRLLKDIGVTPCEVEREAAKPFWAD